LAEAERMHREALAMRKKLLGNEHPDIAGSLYNLAGVFREQGKPAEAEAMFREALAISQKLQKEHPSVVKQLNNLAEMIEARGDFAEAEALWREALAVQKKLHGNEYIERLAALINKLANVLQAQG